MCCYCLCSSCAVITRNVISLNELPFLCDVSRELFDGASRPLAKGQRSNMVCERQKGQKTFI